MMKKATRRVVGLALGLSLTTAASAWTPAVFARAPAPAAERHVLLESTIPAAGDTLAASPPRLTLTFTGPIDRSGWALRIVGPAGRAWALPAMRGAGDARTLESEVPSLSPGGYRVEWSVISADGHPVSGDFLFFVSGAGDLPLAAPAPGAAPGEGMAHASTLLTSVRAGADVALLLSAGLLLFAAWGPSVGPGAGPSGPTRRTLAATDLLTMTAPLLTAWYAWAWAGEVPRTEGPGPPASSVRFDTLTTLSTGHAFLLETGFAILAAWALLLARRPRVASLFAALAVLAGGISGHPASHTPAISMPANAVHQLAAAAWVGGLLFVVTEAGSTDFARSVRRVSRVAFFAVVSVAATGLVQSWLLIGSAGGLLTTPFGRVLVAKGVAFALLVGLGAYHRYRFVPRLAAADAPRTPPPSVAVELALALTVVVLAAVLAHIPPNP